MGGGGGGGGEEIRASAAGLAAHLIDNMDPGIAAEFARAAAEARPFKPGHIRIAAGVIGKTGVSKSVCFKALRKTSHQQPVCDSVPMQCSVSR